MNDLAHSTFYRQFPMALLILVSFTLQLGAQQQLTLEEALDQARNNPAYQAQQQQIQVLEAQLQQAARRPTRPRRGAVERRLEAKRQRGARKAERRGDWT